MRGIPIPELCIALSFIGSDNTVSPEPVHVVLFAEEEMPAALSDPKYALPPIFAERWEEPGVAAYWRDLAGRKNSDTQAYLPR